MFFHDKSYFSNGQPIAEFNKNIATQTQLKQRNLICIFNSLKHKIMKPIVANHIKIVFGGMLVLASFFSVSSFAQVDPSLLAGLKYRMIGPHRGGRTVGISGVNNEPNVFYMGVNNGGVWKTKDYGHTWKPIFDSQNTGSVGDIAVAPSNPNIIYVGSVEGIQRPDLSIGNGLCKSSDA
jgi:hypothetical protein